MGTILQEKARKQGKIAAIKDVKKYLTRLDRKKRGFYERILRVGEKKLCESGFVESFKVVTVFKYINLEKMFSRISNTNTRRKVMSVYGEIFEYLQEKNKISGAYEFPKEQELQEYKTQ